MKRAIISVLIPLLLLSCSKKSIDHQNDASQNQPYPSATSLPFTTTVVEPSESTELYGIKKEANGLFETKSFDKLDELAEKLRDSKETYPHGIWKLYYFYDGINSSGGATDPEWSNHFAVNQDWIKAKPDSITARVALAQGLVAYAWSARGGDYSDKVTDEGWKLFFQRLNEAVEVLTQSKQLKAQDPCWWSALLRAELSLQTERPQFDTTFKDATNAWPDYTPLYFIRAHFLLPRWYGTDGEMEQDLEKSADRIGGEAGDIVYAQVIWDLHHSVPSPNIFEEYHLSWERTKRGLVALERRYPDALTLKSEAAHLAFIAHDPDAAKKYLDQTKGQVDLNAWGSEENYIRCAKLVYGYTP